MNQETDRHEHDQDPRRWLILGICCMSLFIVGLDVSGLNLALASIRRDLHVSPSGLQWILDAYTLVLASLLMLSGSVADRVGRRRVFRIGLVTFGVGSVLCAFATSGPTLIGSRVLQAVGGSMLNPVAMSIITNTFRNPRERAQAIGYWGASVGLSMALGPLIGGVLVETWGWEAVFWTNVPVVIAALVLTTRFIPESRAEHARSLDPIGQLLVMIALGTLTYAIIEGRGLGWTSTPVMACFATAVVALIVLVAVERRIAEPLIDPRFFASVPFSGAVLSAVLGFAAMGGFQLVNTLYLQSARNLSPVHAGLMTLPMAVCTAVLAPVSGRLVGSVGPRIPMLISGVCIGASSLVLLTLSSTTSYWVLSGAYVLFGCGFGLLNAPITNAAVSGMPRAQSGVAAAVASTSRQVGTVLGVAIFGALAFSGLPNGGDMRALGQSSHPAWWAMLGCAVGLLVVAIVATSPFARRTSDRVRESMAVEH